MITVYFFVNGEGLCEREWPCVPRIGETVVMRNPNQAYGVTEVVWDDKIETVVARVHLKPTPPILQPAPHS